MTLLNTWHWISHADRFDACRTCSDLSDAWLFLNPYELTHADLTSIQTEKRSIYYLIPPRSHRPEQWATSGEWIDDQTWLHLTIQSKKVVIW